MLYPAELRAQKTDALGQVQGRLFCQKIIALATYLSGIAELKTIPFDRFR